jgi:hypothetical protein
MHRDDVPWIAVMVALLIVGFLVGQRFLPAADREQQAAPLAADQRSFRLWFWENRGLDLAVQTGLIFVGALSIAALLPRSREDDGK